MNKTPVSVLQELMVQRKERMPDYCIENCSDVPGASFKCTVKIGTFNAFGFASTKKDAKQNSAQKALEILGFSNVVQQQMSSIAFTQCATLKKGSFYVNYVGKLNEYASTHGLSYPVYDDNVMASNGKFITRCCFLQWITEGYGPKKKDSKQEAAKQMLDKLRTKDIVIINNKMESLHTDKKEKINKLGQEILNKYETLSSSMYNVNLNVTEFHPIPNLSKKVTSMEELTNEMEKFGHKYTVETFQRDPYIMMMKIVGTNAVLMGKGDNKQEALRDLFQNAVVMFNHGFSLSSEF